MFMYNNYYNPFISMYNTHYIHCPYFWPIIPTRWQMKPIPIPLDEHSFALNNNSCKKCRSCFEPKFNIKMKKVSIDEIKD